MLTIRRLAVALALVCAVLAIAPARAELTPGGKRVALVIGNGGYRNVDHLPNATNDARLIADTLRVLGFSIVGGNAQLDLDRAHLEDAIREFGKALSGAEVALFYYSGHGLQVKGVNWLVPVDASPVSERDLDFQMVDADLVLRQMDGIGTKLNIVLLDACRNNPFGMSGLRGMQGGLAEMHAPEGTLISYATQPGNVAIDGKGADSPYTEALASSMKQPGLDIFRLFNQVGLTVKKSTDGRQQPWVSTSPIDGDFYFAGSPAAVPNDTAARPSGVASAPASEPSATASPRAVVSSAAVSPAPPGFTSVAPPPSSVGGTTAAPATAATTATTVSPPVMPPVMPASPPVMSATSGSTGSAVPPPAQGATPTAPSSSPGIVTAMAVPPAPPMPAPSQPSDPAGTVRALARAQDCSVLDARMDGDQVHLVGLTREGPEWDRFLRESRATRSIRVGTPEVAFVPAFACELVGVLGDAIRQTSLDDGQRLIVSRPEVVSPTSLSVTLRQGGVPARLDVLEPDGTVQHLITRRTQGSGDESRFIAAAPKPFGTGPLPLLALAGAVPPGLSHRPAVEPAAVWLDALRAAVAAGAGGLRADLAIFEPGPAKPIAAREPVRPAVITERPHPIPAREVEPVHRNTGPCRAALERAALGEPVSPRARVSCR